MSNSSSNQVNISSLLISGSGILFIASVVGDVAQSVLPDLNVSFNLGQRPLLPR